VTDGSFCDTSECPVGKHLRYVEERTQIAAWTNAAQSLRREVRWIMTRDVKKKHRGACTKWGREKTPSNGISHTKTSKALERFPSGPSAGAKMPVSYARY